MPSLNRIILINTHLPGIVELKLDAHTNICGTNASGKTTLQRLVPVFYGELPSRVVPSTRETFERWYLPTEASFIIYEYERMDGELCQAVLASAGDGKGVNYRLMSKTFELDDYVRNRQDDKLSFLTMRELGQEAKRSGLLSTRLLSTKEYRAIIQNDRSQLDTELRPLARQFSLCAPEHSLRHIEKLAKAVHSREGKMETIKMMIAAILEEDGVTPPASNLNPQRVETWIQECQLIQSFEAIRPEFTKLEQEYNSLLSCELRLAGLMRGYRTDETLQWQRQQDANNELEQIGFAQKHLEENWHEERDGLSMAISSFKGDIDRHEEELEGIETQHRDYLEACIEQIKETLERLPTWRTDLANLEARHKLLTEQHQDAEAAYNARRSDVNERLAYELDELMAQQDKQQEKLDTKREQQREELTRLEQEYNTRREQGSSQSTAREVELRTQRGTLEHQVMNMDYTDEERLALTIFDERIKEADEEVEAVRARLEHLQVQEKQLRTKRETANNTLLAATRLVNESQSRLDEINQLLYPGHHSLLEFLRREHVGWESTLGKVIHPQLLNRSDLKPALLESGDHAFYGVQLDLTALELPECANSEQQLRLWLEEAEQALVEAKNHQTEGESRLAQINDEFNEQGRMITLAQIEQKNKREDLLRIRQEKSIQQEKNQAQRTERKWKAQKQLTVLDNALEQLLMDHQAWLEELKTQFEKTRQEKNAYWQEVIGTIDTHIERIKSGIKDRRSKAGEELNACEQWLRQELKTRGVDEAEVLRLKQSIRELAERIAQTERCHNEVRDYDHWHQQIWLQRKPKLQDLLSEAKAHLIGQEQRLKDAIDAYKSTRTELESKANAAKKKRAETEENLTRLKSLLRKLAELTLPRSDELLMGEVGERLRLGDELLFERDQLLASIKTYVERFDSVIASKSGSSLAEFWERSREECIYITDKGVRMLDHRKLVPQLEQLLNHMVPQSLTALREQGRIFGIDLNAYYDVLADIDRRIVSQSARITREVGEELFLDGVSDSAVHLRSRISELEFWPELQTFVRAFREWQAEGFTNLPSTDYSTSMRRALDIIGRSASSGGIASLLGIELRLREGNSDLVIRTDRQLSESSSLGMAYLILCKFLLAFTRLLRGRAQVTVHWPIDELGTLHPDNIKKIFEACGNNAIRVLGAFPNPESEVLNLFVNRYIINKQTKQLQVVKPKLDPIAEKLKQKQALEMR